MEGSHKATSAELEAWKTLGASAPVQGIHAAILAVYKDVEKVRKERQHPQHKFRFTGHDDVTEALRDSFVENGIIQEVSVSDFSRSDLGHVRCMVHVRWICVADGSFLAVAMPGESIAVTTRDGRVIADDLQVGKAVSYAVKTAQLKTFMLIGGIPDNEAAGADAPAPQTPPSSAPPKEASAQQIQLFVAEYQKLQTRDELAKLRNALQSYVSGLTDGDYRLLENADREADQRLPR